MSDHNVLLSWSKPLSHKIAKVLKDWLPTVVPGVIPWISSSHIDKGKLWFPELVKQLQSVEFGIVCLTRENIFSPYLYYEAGAIASKLSETSIYPVLFGLEKQDISDLKDTPFAPFNWTSYSEDDIRILISSLSKHMKLQYHESHLDDSFKLKWPNLKKKIDALLAESPALPLVGPVVKELKLSTEAHQILVAASKSTDGMILIGEDRGGFYCQAAEKDLCEPKTAPVQAAYRAAIKELFRLDLLDERNPDVLYSVSDAGYKLAKELEPPLPSMQPEPKKSHQQQAAESHAFFNKLKYELDELMVTWRNTRPTSGRADLMPKMQEDFGKKMKQKLADLLVLARDEADKVAFSGYLGTLAEIERIEPEFHALEKFGKRQQDAIEAILRKLS